MIFLRACRMTRKLLPIGAGFEMETAANTG